MLKFLLAKIIVSRVHVYMIRHVIHTTLIAFYDLISKIDTTVTKCDFTLNSFVSILAGSHPSYNSSVAKAEGMTPLGSEGWWFNTSWGPTFSQVMMR